MINFKISDGIYGDVETWVHDSDVHSKLYRVWLKSEIEEECSYKYFSEFIMLPDGDILIGMQGHDDRCENNKYPMVNYHKLSEIEFAYCESDNDGSED